MSTTDTRTSRRAFFLSGGAALGAGVATTAGASSLDGKPQQLDLRQRLAMLEEREAIGRLQLAFTTLIEAREFEAVADLFDEQAHLRLSGLTADGKAAIRQLFTEQYRHQKAAAIHDAYRPNSLRQADTVTLSDDGLRASAMYHVDVALSMPLQGDCTAAEMARLQGQVADRHWESGRFVAKYVKAQGQWKMTSLNYPAI